MKILGISAYYHDSAACLLVDGNIIVAAQEERFSRIKHDSSFPKYAVQFCLNKLKGVERKIDAIAFYDNWALKRRRSIDNALIFGPVASSHLIESINNIRKEKDLKNNIKTIFGWSESKIKDKLYFIQHHYSHAASAYYCSPFKNSGVLTLDGVGEYSTTTIGTGHSGKLHLLHSIDYPNSLGLFYSTFTHYLGFKVNSGEYKVMGLAPYGNPNYKKKILDEIINLNSDGSFELNLDYFNFHLTKKMANEKNISEFLKIYPRKESEEMTKQHMDLAASVQEVLEQAIESLLINTVKFTGYKDVSLAGGVALNCKALGRLRNKNIINNIFVQPASGDAGGSMGAAIALYCNKKDYSSTESFNFTVFCGPKIERSKAEKFFIKRGCPYKRYNKEALVEKVVQSLLEKKIVALCQGKAEWGPRALGGRSILANPLQKNIKDILNMKIKQREGFRPFAPAGLSECMEKIFINPAPSPHMSFVFFLKEKFRKSSSKLELNKKILSSTEFINLKSAVIHDDWSARVQTVTSETNGIFYDIIKLFYQTTGCPMLINTSFNVRGEPPVLDYCDSFRCFMRAQIDLLVVENLLLERSFQPLLEPHEIEQFNPD